MIRAFATDLDDTLYDHAGTLSHRRLQAAVDALEQAGLNSRILDEVKTLYNEQLRSFQEIISSLKGRVDEEILQKTWHAFNSIPIENIKLFPDVPYTLESLHQKGIVTAIITTGIRGHQEKKICTLGLEGKTDKVYFADYDPTKKDKMQDFQRDYGFKFQDMLYIDDKIFSGIKYANELGAITVQILQGRYKDRRPRNHLEKPNYQVHNVSEVLGIIDEIDEKKKKLG